MPYKNKEDRAAAGRRRNARIRLGLKTASQPEKSRYKSGCAVSLPINALIQVTPALKNYRKALVERMPTWREEQIQKAHAAFLKEKNSPNRSPYITLERY